MTTLTAITASSFVNSLGINTHIDFNAYGYQNLATVEAAINYLGIKNIRDSASNGSDASTWLQVADATGAKFDDYIGQTSPSGMSTELGYVAQLASEGILNYIEGGNEEDDAYPEALGNNQWIAASFQQQVYALGQSLGLPVINMSFGAGWTAANGWTGNYGTVGDLSAYANYANAHTYPNVGQTPAAAIQQINGDAHLAAASRQVMNTEMGWNASLFSQGAIAQYVVQGALDSMQAGNAKTYFYALFNDGSGPYGLMNSNGTATPAGTALHDLTTLLADTGANAASFTPGSLNFTLSGAQAGDNTLLIQKSDGSDWLALWDETAGTHSITLNLASNASQILVFDPVTGTSSIASANNTNSITVSLGNDPLLIEVIPTGGTTVGSTGTGSGGSTGSTGGSSGSTGSTGSTGSGSGSTTGTGSTSSAGMSVAAPASVSDPSGHTVAIGGVQVTDTYASTHPATVTATITDQTGTLTAVDAWGVTHQGSGTAGITLTGTIWQVNAALSNLTYSGGTSDTITIHTTDSSGQQATQTVAIGGSSSTGGGTTSTGTPGQVIAATTTTAVITASNTTISATAGDHMIFISGTGDTLSATGGTETVQAYTGGNSITTGAGDDTIRVAGSGNTINAGSGNNLISDSGSGNTIVLPGGNLGSDNIYGWVMQNGDVFDLRPLLAATGWNGNAGTIGNYVQVSVSGNNAVVSVDPSGVAGGASYSVATLNASGNMNLSTLLAHSIT